MPRAASPHPDILTAALDQSGFDADSAVFVGDSVWDAEAAAKSGIAFVAVACGGTPARELRDAGAIETWRDPAELLDRPRRQRHQPFAIARRRTWVVLR